MVKPTIGVFFGSRSAEHDVSIITAISSVIRPLQAHNEYKVVPVYIAKNGAWYSDSSLADIVTYQSPEFPKLLQRLKPVTLQLGDGKLVLSKGGMRPKSVVIDIAFPATHGTYGEDGALMGLFEMAGIPYVGCDVAASAIAMNKILAKQLVQSHGLAIVPFMTVTKTEVTQNLTEVVSTAANKFLGKGKVAFVKPARLGSSIGISRVATKEELSNAIEVAAHYDTDILIEEGIEHLIEVTVPVLGNHHPKVGLVERPLVAPEDFFDFESKYIGQGKKMGAKVAQQGAQGYSELPAKLPKKLYATCEQVALAAFAAVGCAGIARVDLLINQKTETVYVNEINPLPGSLYAHNWNAAGISSAQLVQELVTMALERAEEKRQLNTSFASSFIGQFA